MVIILANTEEEKSPKVKKKIVTSTSTSSSSKTTHFTATFDASNLLGILMVLVFLANERDFLMQETTEN